MSKFLLSLPLLMLMASHTLASKNGICTSFYDQESIEFLNTHFFSMELLEQSELLNSLQEKDLKRRFTFLNQVYKGFAQNYESLVASSGAASAKERIEILVDLSEELNLLTLISFHSLRRAGVKVILKKWPENSSRSISYTIDIIKEDALGSPLLNNITNLSFEKGVEIVSFNFFKTLVAGELGAYLRKDGVLQLSFAALYEAIHFPKKIPMIVSHEAEHANFSSMRKEGIDSIFYSEYRSHGESPLYDAIDIYRDFMSSEEVYTFANNPLWTSTPINNLLDLGPNEYRNELYLITKFLYQAPKIFSQTAYLAENSLKQIDNLLRGDLPLHFILEPSNLSQKIEDGASLWVELRMKDYMFKDWISLAPGSIIRSQDEIYRTALLKMRDKQEELYTVSRKLLEVTRRVTKSVDLFVDEREMKNWLVDPSIDSELGAYRLIQEKLEELSAVGDKYVQ